MLTGMGRDGLDGARRLVECGGAMLAQDRHSSAIWGMPRAVAEAGLASAVLPPAELARRIAARVEAALMEVSDSSQPHPRRPARGAHRPAADDEPALADRDRAGRARCASAASDARPAGRHPGHRAASRALADAGGRGPAQQRNLFLPRPDCRSTCCSAAPLKLARAARGSDEAAVDLVAGCSTGQEAYSLAMSFADETARWHGWTIEIVGTDLSRERDRPRPRRHLFASSRSSAACRSCR